MRVVIIGSGNVAEALARAAAAEGIEVVQVWARNEARGREVARIAGCPWCGTAEGLAPAELYLIAVRDAAIEEVAAALPFATGAIVAHTAGCGRLEMLPAALRRAVLYPFQSFTAGRTLDFRKVPLFVEAEDDATLQELLAFARRLSDTVAEADAARRERIHLAGVFANNFTNAMLGCAGEVLRSAGLPFGVLAPILAETVAKAVESAAPRTVQTGPAVRDDGATQARHLQLLTENADLQEIYKEISKLIWKTSKR